MTARAVVLSTQAGEMQINSIHNRVSIRRSSYACYE